MRSVNFERLILVLLLCCFLYIIYLKRKLVTNSVESFYSKNFESVKPNIKIIDLSGKLTSEYDNIECKRSTGYSNLNPLFCVHPNDYVSGILLSNQVYESEILGSIVGYLKEYKDPLFLDVGTMIGAFSLVIAKMGYQVVSVEPFYENVLRIHKASHLDKTHNNIVLINNALSNKRNEIKMLKPLSSNIGGQSLLDYDHVKFTQNRENKYLVETILFDDIVGYLPLKKDNTKYSNTILKIDIEGFEPYAFEKSNLLFNVLDIKVIYMEWSMIQRNKNESVPKSLIDLLVSRDYLVYNVNTLLAIDLWKNWPINIVWRKKGIKII